MGILGIAGLVLGGGGVIGLLVFAAPAVSLLAGIVGPKAAKPVLYIVGALLLALALWGAWATWLGHHDKGVIAQHEAVIANQVSAETNTATAKADAQANVTAAHNGEIHNQVEEAISNAVTAHPVEAHRSAGPASSAALARLRSRRR